MGARNPKRMSPVNQVLGSSSEVLNQKRISLQNLSVASNLARKRRKLLRNCVNK